MKHLLLISLASVLLLSVGCSNDDDGAADPAVPAPVTLLTRAATETTAVHRLLVFPASGNTSKTGDADCLLNYSFASGTVLNLITGSYRFVTLTESSCLDLPVAGETGGLEFDKLISLKDGATLEPVQISPPAEVTLPETASYTAILQPATCILKLQLTDAPEGLTLQLTNMYGGIPLSGRYATSASAITYALNEGENICLPTQGNAVLKYQYKAESGTFDLGMSFEPGYTYSASLQWHNGKLKITSTVENWQDGSDETGDAE